MKKSILLLFFCIAITKTSCIFAKNVLGGWFTYDQQLGALDKQFIALGGVNTGISVLGIALGLGIYGNYPFKKDFVVYQDEIQLFYGGLNIGYKKKWDIVGIRSVILLGGGSVQIKSNIDPQFGVHFVISPMFYLDISLYKSLVLSVGMTYRYFNGASQRYYIDINRAQNSFLGNISLGFVY